MVVPTLIVFSSSALYIFTFKKAKNKGHSQFSKKTMPCIKKKYIEYDLMATIKCQECLVLKTMESPSMYLEQNYSSNSQ